MEIVEKIKAAGVVGCGGAGFPTHKKLAGSIEYLIVNGAECEPLLRTDRYLMLFQAPRLVKAVAALGRELGITLILVTHDLSIAEQADRILTLADGRVIRDSVGEVRPE